jgi:hypothetical protein
MIYSVQEEVYTSSFLIVKQHDTVRIVHEVLVAVLIIRTKFIIEGIGMKQSVILNKNF